MKRYLKYIITFIFLSTIGLSQPFKLSDTKVSTGQFLHLYEIHFEFVSPNLQPTGNQQLDSLVMFLKNNPIVKIELGVHTDFRGDDKQNFELSKKRATTLLQYIVEHGIAKDRVKAIGFGESKPVIEYENWKKLMDSHRCGYYGRGNKRVTILVISTN